MSIQSYFKENLLQQVLRIGFRLKHLKGNCEHIAFISIGKDFKCRFIA